MKYQDLHKLKQEQEMQLYTFYPNLHLKDTTKKHPSN